MSSTKSFIESAMAAGNQAKGWVGDTWEEGCNTVVGGAAGGCMFGGVEELKRYDASESSKAKKDIVKKLSAGISKAMGVSAPGANATVGDMVAHLIKIVPNPRKGKSIVPNKGKQDALCKSVAKVVNDVYGDVIDMGLSSDGMCNQISELLETLGEGINQEYVAVAASVNKALQNLTDVHDLLTRSYNKLYNEAKGSSDSSLAAEARSIKTVHDAILKELKRQIALLSNITKSVIKDTNRDIAQLLSENKDFKGLVQSIDAEVGSAEWGDKIASVLAGISDTAQIAAKVERALKDIGIKAADYKKIDNLTDLTLLAHKAMEGKSRDKLTKDYMNKYYKAMDVLRAYHGKKKEFQHEVKTGGSATGGCGDVSGAAGSSCPLVEGGRVKLKKKLKTQQRTRLALLKDFKTKSKIHMDRVYKSVFDIGKKIGQGKIPLTDELYRFKSILNDMSSVFVEGIEYALTGYYKSSGALQQKERFVGLMQGMLLSLDELKDASPEFKTIHAEVESVVKLIDFFNDQFKVHTEKAVEYEGAGEFRAAVTLNNAKNAFNHYYNIAKFKKNLERASTEMKSYNKDYNSVVGVAVGKKLDDLREECKKAIEDLKDTRVKTTLDMMTNPESEIADFKDAGKEARGGVLTSEWSADNIADVLKAQLAAKEKLYKVAQAVDQYLQKFTDAVITSPEDIQKVAKLLSSVELVANWFSEKSGDSIASLYELFPYSLTGLRTNMNTKLQGETVLSDTGIDAKIVRTRIQEGKHYYELVSESKQKVANPYLPISPGRALFAHRFAKYAVEKVYVLKNIVSAFAYLGRKFGGEDIAASTFLSPNEIYKYLTEYLYVSALTMGWGGSEGKQSREYGLTKADSDYAPPLGYAVPETTTYARTPRAGLSREGSAVVVVKSRYSCVMACIEDSEEIKVGNVVSLSGWKSVFYEEDKIFVNVIKSMAAKVFTVTGLYNMMHFSKAGNIRNYALSPTRLVLGGAESSAYATPKIYEEAMELYVRLPPLAEFYRKVFCFEEPCDDKSPDQLLISMVPEVGSLWAGFIAAIFDQPINTDGLYTDNVLKKLVHEINSVYLVFKNRGSKDVTTDAITDFIAEINGRYGLMNRGEIKQYQDEEEERHRALNFGDARDAEADHDILDSDLVGTGVAPSDRYTQIHGSVAEPEHTLDGNIYEALKTFRRRIDKHISSVVLKGGKDGFDKDDYQTNIPEFGRLIMSSRDSLKNEADPTRRFNVVKRVMIGMDVKTQTDQEAAVMFHECIVAPIAVLKSITNILQTYRNEVRSWDAYSMFKASYEDKGIDEVLKDRTGKQELAVSIRDNLARTDNEVFEERFMGSEGITYEALETTFDDHLAEKFDKSGDDTFTWKRHVAYIGIRWEACFKRLTNAVFGLTSGLGDLCDVQIQGSRVIVNHSRLQALCEEVLATVRKNIDKFRGSVSQDTIEKQMKGIMDVHDRLLSKLFGDDDGTSGLGRAHACVTKSFQLLANVNPDDLSKQVTYAGLEKHGDITGDDDYKVRKQGWCVDGVLSEMTHYNPRTLWVNGFSGSTYSEEGNTEEKRNFASEGQVKISEIEHDVLAHLIKPTEDETLGSVWHSRVNFYLQNNAGGDSDAGFRGDAHNNGARRTPADGAEHSNIAENIDTGAGLMIKFNEVMAQYLQQFWDPVSLKIYAPLIEGPANGPMNLAVFKAQGHPDIVLPGSMIDDDPNAVFSSIIGSILGTEVKLDITKLEDATKTINDLDVKDVSAEKKKEAIELLNQSVNFAHALNTAMALHAGGADDTALFAAMALLSGDPKELLFASLSKAMRSALTRTRKGVKVNVIQSIAEVPLRLKENMKANLPIFCNMFKLMSKRADLLRGLLRLNIGVDRPELTLAGGLPEQRGVHAAVEPVVARDQATGRTWYGRWLDKISATCDDMVSTIKSVISELNDAPLYLELNEDSIMNYRNKTNMLPFMPLSSTSLMLSPAKSTDVDVWNHGEFRDPNLGQPSSSVGDRHFMFNYGVRLLLNDYDARPMLEHMPGVTDILTKYNTVASSNRRLEKELYGKFAGKVVDLTRYAGHAKVYSSLFGASWKLVDPVIEEVKFEEPTFQQKSGLDATIELTSSADKDSSVAMVADYVDEAKSTMKINRDSTMVYNLLDLNVSPINIHAMRREIPLANLYNYAYTFDTFVTYAVQSSYESDVVKDNVTTHEFMSALCKDPYARISKTVFYNALETMVGDNSSLDMHGRPQFISDQIWGKVLLQNAAFPDQGRNDDSARPGGLTNDGLEYTKNGKLEEVKINNAKVFAEIGRMRFDSKFIRNLVFLANVQRLMLYKINTELTEIQHPVVSDAAITNRKMVDYNDAETHADLQID